MQGTYLTKEGDRMKKIELYQKVLLKDGRNATIVEILEENKAYIADIDLPGPDWETIQIKYSDIKDLC